MGDAFTQNVISSVCESGIKLVKEEVKRLLRRRSMCLFCWVLKKKAPRHL